MNSESEEVTQVLRKAKQLLIDVGWGQGKYVEYNDDGSVKCYCAKGALLEATRNRPLSLYGIAHFLLDRAAINFRDATKDPMTLGVVNFNDSPRTTKDDVIAVYDDAIVRSIQLSESTNS